MDPPVHQDQSDEVEQVTDWYVLEPERLRITSHPTWEQAKHLLDALITMEESVQIWIGDLLNYLEFRWGETYPQMIEATGYSYSRLADFKYTMSRVEDDMRDPSLTFSHYSAVASLSEDERRSELKRATEHEVSARQLRRDKRIRLDPANPGAYSVRHVKMVMRALLEAQRQLTSATENPDLLDRDIYQRRLRQRDKFGGWLARWAGWEGSENA